jgi:hypothetical protein
MIYVLIPHTARTYEDYRLFTTFAMAEQQIFMVAGAYEREGRDPDWCCLIAYDGVDEVQPVFLYSVIASDRLHREPYPSPST